MANYVTQTSDKSRDVALQKWKKGCFGVFGLENFYVGKIGRGLVHFVVGIFFFPIEFSVIAALFSESSSIPSGEMPVYILSALIMIVGFWAILAVPNLYRLKMGTFRDNIGAVLRE